MRKMDKIYKTACISKLIKKDKTTSIKKLREYFEKLNDG